MVWTCFWGPYKYYPLSLVGAGSDAHPGAVGEEGGVGPVCQALQGDVAVDDSRAASLVYACAMAHQVQAPLL